MSIEQLIESFGYLALFVGTFLEGETVLVLAGFAAQRGHLALPWVMVVAFAGSLLGDQLFFLLGRWKGKAFLDRRVSWRPRVEQANRLLERHHTWILLGFRFLYGLRSVIPFVIGTTRIPTGRFIVLTVIGGIVWAVVVGWLGYLFGQAMAALLEDVKRYELVILGALAAGGFVIWGISHLRTRRRVARAAAAAAAAAMQDPK